MKRIAILGSTGSIGRQTVDVIRMHSDIMCASVLVAKSNVEALAQQAAILKPNRVIIADESLRDKLVSLLDGTGIQVLAGSQAIDDAVQYDDVDVVVAAMVGFSGFSPTMKAIQAGKNVALANKETLVVAGSLVMSAARQHGVSILPVDSEHSAIFQCLNGERHLSPRRVILTASGGPFRGWSHSQLQNVTPQMALKHPNWSMGAKVTIDSASMMNKGLEAIEASWLFDCDADHIDIVVHPQSIVHSMVEFDDFTIKAQLGVPDMRMPIQYALTFPDRLPSPAEPLDFAKFSNLTFERPDMDVFRNLPLALNAMRKGGNAPCIMNGANEVAVASFLQGRIGFLEMTDLINSVIDKATWIQSPSMDDFYQSDAQARRLASQFVDALA